MSSLTYEQAAELAQEARHLSTPDEIQAIYDSQRRCPCVRDSHFSTTGEIEVEAFVAAPCDCAGCVGSGDPCTEIYFAARRPCGFVGVWDSAWILSPDDENFWHNIHRRVEKQCQSLYDWKGEP